MVRKLKNSEQYVTAADPYDLKYVMQTSLEPDGLLKNSPVGLCKFLVLSLDIDFNNTTGFRQ